MSAGHRRARLAAQRAEDCVGAIAKQEEETRFELYSIAQYEERSAHIDRLPSKIVSLRLGTEKGLEGLKQLAEKNPDAAEPVRPFATLKFVTDIAKARFKEFLKRPIVIESGLEREEEADIQAVRVINDENNEDNINVAIVVDDIRGLEQQQAHVCAATAGQGAATDGRHRRRRRRSSSVPIPGRSSRSTLGHFLPPNSQIRNHPPIRHNPPSQQVIRMPPITADIQANTLQPCVDTYRGRPKTLPTLPTAVSFPDKIPFVTRRPIRKSLLDHRTPHDVSFALTPSGTNSPMQKTPKFAVLQACEGSFETQNDPLSRPVDIVDGLLMDPPEHISYRIGPQLDQRLLKYQRPPMGWEGCVTSVYNHDYSDPRFWPAVTEGEQDMIWRALHPTVRQYSDITGEDFSRGQAVLLPFGYDATYTHIHTKFSQWCFSTLGFKHQWTTGGKVIHKLFKLERWYGLLEDYAFAPNWPHRLRDSNHKVIQNPDCFACRECIQLDVFCHGHREDYRRRCKPCLANRRDCSKRLN